VTVKIEQRKWTQDLGIGLPLPMFHLRPSFNSEVWWTYELDEATARAFSPALVGLNNKQGPFVAQTRNVLIVEGQEILAENLQTHLHRCGWNARIAPTGKSAVIAAREFRPALMLLEYQLPDMKGFEVLNAIGAAPHRCGCVLMTGYPTDMVLADAQRHGIGHILSKPFALAGLHGVLLATAADFHYKPNENRRGASRLDFGGFTPSPSLLGNFANSV